MNDLLKYFSTCLLGFVTLIVGGSPAWAQVSLGAASGFAVLGGTNVTCTAPGSVIGDVGVAPGAVPPFTNTGCVITGATPPATNAAAVGARAAFLDSYTTIQSMPCTDTTTLAGATITGPKTLPPGVYCTSTALTGAGVLTLDAGGNANAVWVFKIGAALTGTGFSVVMANGGQPCNVFWAPNADVTLTTSAFSGNILAGGVPGSVTMTGGTLAGRVLANAAVTMTGTNVIGCATLTGSPPSSCKDKDCDGKDKKPGKCNDGKDDEKGHGSDSRFPFESKHDDGGKGGK